MQSGIEQCRAAMQSSSMDGVYWAAIVDRYEKRLAAMRSQQARAILVCPTGRLLSDYLFGSHLLLKRSSDTFPALCAVLYRRPLRWIST
jgi:hypothetical protein